MKFKVKEDIKSFVLNRFNTSSDPYFVKSSLPIFTLHKLGSILSSSHKHDLSWS